MTLVASGARVFDDSDDAIVSSAEVVVEAVLDVRELRELIRRLDRLGTPALVLVAPDLMDFSVEVLRAGARSVLPLDTDPTSLVAAHDAVASGFGVVTRSDLEFAVMHTRDNPLISAAEIDWLTQLSHGSTVAEVAETASYSERSFYRVLHGIYQRLGVNNRYEAFELLNQAGYL